MGLTEEDFLMLNDDSAWDFFKMLEDEYDCSGLCYEPLFYLTKDISLGKPPKECLQPFFEDVFVRVQWHSANFGSALLLSGFL